MFCYRTVSVNPKIPERIAKLQEIAYNTWFSWNPQATDLFKKINEALWEQVYHSPTRFLISVTQEALDHVAVDEEYLTCFDKVMSQYESYMQGDKWFSKTFPQHQDDVVAYFSAEFGLHESLPIYSGGLGLLAGDHSKASSDLGLPLVGVGLLYKQGYFTQQINKDGWQKAEYCNLNFSEMPIKHVVDESGKEVIISLQFPGRTIYLKLWKVTVGVINIYLLDTDISLNSKEDRLLTSQLYGGGNEMRISQEIILGIGGVKALRSMNIQPLAWHINEGHAAFSTLERLRELVRHGVPFATAKEVVKAGTLFTTHTPVPAGHDVFSEDLVEKYLSSVYYELGLNKDEFMKLALETHRSGFNMTMLAMNLSAFTNGVSKLHGAVTRKMFIGHYRNIPMEEMPIQSITNGVHTKTWLAQEYADLFAQYLGEDWYLKISDQATWQKIDNVPNEKIWEVHNKLKQKAIDYLRQNVRNQRQRNKESADRLLEVENFFSPDVLTIGFARRFATYKRATLLFKDRQRLIKMLTNADRPVQIIFAGKAHPADQPGKEFIKAIYDISNEETFKGRIIFLENYDINVARYLVQGVDIWLNTPRWPMEASGTSGMKAALNGVLNCSVLDGWWPEAYDGENGYAIGEEKEYPSEEEQDRDDACYLYRLLEEKIVPAYYDCNQWCGNHWCEKMKKCLKSIPWQFSTERMVKEYTEKYYVRCMERNKDLISNNYQIANELKGFKQFVSENWHHVVVQKISASSSEDMHVGDELHLQAQVKLGPISQQYVDVEIFFGKEKGDGLQEIRSVPMKCLKEVAEGCYQYEGSTILEQGILGYTVRIIPINKFFAQKFELPLVEWAPNF